ncbi:MAG: hypothetical protein CVT88_07830 [Candidatus Altiarchaeales archaeon HGW-Altiarchaeales-1]|nr:MAG: hypothetical protein CVT88_07830 [Candidatus Altiarchaeales archaeon HGW-Altiarchaeales-1]
MEFVEEKLEFVDPVKIEDSLLMKSFSRNSIPAIKKNLSDVETAGVIVRIGNRPIVRNLKEILELSNANIPPEIEVLFKKSDIYSIVHGIGAIRVEGNASIIELQYHAKVENINGAQIIDLIPSTKFRDVVKVGVIIQGSMSAIGATSIQIPEELTRTLLPKYLSLGGDMRIQLSSNASFIGKFDFSVKFPVVQSLGASSDSCSWVLNPDEHKTPLLGDQQLIQIIAVPKGTTKLKYKSWGVLKVDRQPWIPFIGDETKKTSDVDLDVDL